MTTPFDYDADPQRFRLASRLTREHLLAERSLYELLADVLAGLGARRVLAPGGVFVAATASRHDSPELAHVWRPPLASFDAEDGPGLVASVFGEARVERWDAPLVRLPDRAAVRDYLIARFVPREAAVTAAGQVTTPATITKRGALIYAGRERGRRTDSNSDSD